LHLIIGNFTEAENRLHEALRLAQPYKGRRSEARAYLALASHGLSTATSTRQGYFQQALPTLRAWRACQRDFPGYVIQGRTTRGRQLRSRQKRFEQLLTLAPQVNEQSTTLAYDGLGRLLVSGQNFPRAVLCRNWMVANALS